MTPIRWGVLGASNFAREHMAPAIHGARGAVLAALGTSHPDKADPFRALVPDLRVHESYDAVLDDPDIDAVYIPLPNHLHAEWTVKSLEAGKHVLCEKPIALREDDFDRLIKARDRTGKLAAEGFMIVHHPQMQRAREIVQSGTLGKLVQVDGAFSFFNDDMDNIRNQAEAGGGALCDIGVYICGAARFITGQEPQTVDYAKITLHNGVDTSVRVAADFGTFDYSGVVSIRAFNRQHLVIHGEKGVLRLTCPFNAGVFDQAEIHLETDKGTRTVERFPGVAQYRLQVERFCEAVTTGGTYDCPLEFSRGTQRMIDMIRTAGGQTLLGGK